MIIYKKFILIISTYIGIIALICFSLLINESKADHHLGKPFLKLDKLFSKCTFILFVDDSLNEEIFSLFNKCKTGNTVQVQIGMEVDVKKIHSVSRSLDMIGGWFCDVNKPLHIKYPSISNRHASMLCIRNKNILPEEFLKQKN